MKDFNWKVNLEPCYLLCLSIFDKLEEFHEDIMDFL